MRPLRLEMHAFGPYRGVEIIDFTQLMERALLLIHGPTGAGKTTLLDAICFALFGDTSGAERTASQMRSQLADAEHATEVTFEFALGAKRYRVRRSPEHERKKRRGTGTMTQTSTADLWQLSSDSLPAMEAHLASGADKVTQHITTLFGFQAEQFRQVVMLPQGQFMRFLAASSKEKELLLQRLFDTARYARVTDTLHESAQALQRAWKALDSERKTLLAQADVETEEALEAALSAWATQAEHAKQAEHDAKAASEVCRKAVETARDVDLRLRALHDEARAVGALEAQLASIAALRARLAQAERAAPLLEAKMNLDARALDRDAAINASAEAQTAQAERAHAAQQARDAYQRQLERADQREAAEHEHEQLRALVGHVAELERAEAAAQEAERAHSTAEDAFAATVALVAQTKADVDAHAARLVRTQEVAAKLPALEADHERCERALRDADALRAARKRLRDAVSLSTGAAQSAADANAANATLEVERRTLDDLFRRGQAAVLARGLVPNAPCPVCGSEAHPRPAALNDAVPTHADLDDVAARAQATESHARECDRALASARMAERAATERLTELTQTVHERAPDDMATLQEHLARIAEDIEVAQAARQRLAEEEEQLHTARQRHFDAESGASERQNALSAARDARTELLAKRDVHADKVPETLRRDGALVAAMAFAEERKHALLRSFDLAREVLEGADRLHASAAGTAEALDRALARAIEAHDEARESLGRRRVQSSLADDAEFEKACADVPQLVDFQAELKRFDDATAAARGRHAQAAERARGLVAPDLPGLQKAVDHAQAAHQATIEARVGLEGKHSDGIKLLEACRARATQAALLEAEHRVAGRVAEVARGDGHNRLNMSLQRYVLATHLDDVLLQASLRLARMSQGRYTLARTEQVTDRRTAAGLDLLVQDAYTGDARPVATLSGGESFLAALALSLGLSDVVQGYAGGVHLDTLFIDEGFGSLDSEALDAALAVLESLNAGNRLVAIISHVSELRERIDTRLEVRVSERGSTTELHVP